MFEFIEGTLEEKSPESIAINCRGVGYLLFIPVNCFHELPQIGTPVRMYTSFIVREDSQRLFGFLERSERDLFSTLKDISGIGPKTALSLIGHLEKNALLEAVHASNTKLISKVPGIGKKTAERLVIELRDKKMTSSFSVKDVSLTAEEQLKADGVSALMSLGYSPIQAEKAVDKTLKVSEDTLDLPLLITTSLKNM